MALSEHPYYPPHALLQGLGENTADVPDAFSPIVVLVNVYIVVLQLFKARIEAAWQPPLAPQQYDLPTAVWFAFCELFFNPVASGWS